MARKRSRDAEASREAILRSAQEVLIKRGYHGANMERIARGAGVAKGTVFLHFGNKENLLLALVKHHYARVERLYAQMVRPGKSARRQLEDMAAAENWMEDEVTDISRTILSMWADLPARLQRRMGVLIRRNYNRYLKSVTGLFREFLGGDGACGVSAEVLAATFLASCDGLVIRTHMLPSVQSSPLRVGRALKLLFVTNMARHARRKGARR